MSLPASYAAPRLASTVGAILAVSIPGLAIATIGRPAAAAAGVTVTAVLARLLRDLAGGPGTPRLGHPRLRHKAARHR